MRDMDKCDACIASEQSDSLFCQDCQKKTAQRRRIADRAKQQYEIKVEESEICRN